MPNYEYVCDNCGDEFEENHPMQITRQKCKKCGQWKLRKLISGGVSFRFKGPGFYENDYKRKDRPDEHS